MRTIPACPHPFSLPPAFPPQATALAQPPQTSCRLRGTGHRDCPPFIHTHYLPNEDKVGTDQPDPSSVPSTNPSGSIVLSQAPVSGHSFPLHSKGRAIWLPRASRRTRKAVRLEPACSRAQGLEKCSGILPRTSHLTVRRDAWCSVMS